MLRHTFRELRPEGAHRDLFGFQDRKEGRPSRVSISWGQIHGADDRPVPFRGPPEAIEADPLLRAAQHPVVRPHVRMGRRGAADAGGRGLFDESLVAAGHRFTFEICVSDGEPDDLNYLLSLLASAGVRLGGKTRRGCGAFEVVRVLRRRFDITDPAGIDRLALVPVALEEPPPEGVLEDITDEVLHHPARDVLVATLRLAPTGYWMISGGEPAGDTDGRQPDMLPYREPRVLWRDGRGRYEPENPSVVVPATSFKGVVRHRTAFHLNCLEGSYADEQGADLDGMDSAGHPEVKKLFGTVALQKQEDGPQTLAGHVHFSDVVLDQEPKSGEVNHVSLDRFTQGPMTGMLFSERPLWQEPTGKGWEMEVTVSQPGKVAPRARQALGLALQDLVQERLHLGAGTGRGLGWFKGEVRWSDEGRWLRGEAATDLNGGAR